MFKVLAASLAFLATGVTAIGEDGVLALTDATFNDFVGKDVPALVEFYAPWCGHCKNLAPEYVRVAEVFKDATSSVVVAKFDADANKEKPTLFEVKGFPTLKWFSKGGAAVKAAKEDYVVEDYEGERTAEAIVDFINAKTGLVRKLKVAPTAVVALTPETFDTVVSNDATFKLLEFYAPWCGHCKSLSPIYEKLGGVFQGDSDKVVIAKIDADKHRSLGERFGVEGFPTIKFIAPGAFASAGGGKKPEAVAEPYEGPRDLAGLVAFVNSKAGTFRSETGGLTAEAGRVAALDDEAAALGKAPSAAGLAALKAAAAALTGKDAAAGALYVKVGEKVAEKGAAYIAKETARLEGMLASEEVKPEKKTELAFKKNVLAAFAITEDNDPEL